MIKVFFQVFHHNLLKGDRIQATNDLVNILSTEWSTVLKLLFVSFPFLHNRNCLLLNNYHHAANFVWDFCREFPILWNLHAEIYTFIYSLYRNAEFGHLLKKLIWISDRFPLFNVKKLRLDSEIWYLIKEKRKELIEDPFDLRKLEKFIVEFKMIYRKLIVVFDTNIVENCRFEDQWRIACLLFLLQSSLMEYIPFG